ncbi:MAG: hypothetical protein IPM96_14145 [Ignavibacteria bacterium]|nr:hypothetical protein [Ignavibacteria bacterium]
MNHDKVYYDFTKSNEQAFGNNLIQAGKVWCIYSGDINQDGVIDGSDQGIVDNDIFNFASGYIPSDLNGDLIVDAADAVFTENNGVNFISIIRP